MAVKFSNNASTTLSAGISSGVTSFQVTSNSGFPTLGGSDWTYVTIDSEVVKVTAISGTTFTCDATSEAHSNGDNVELRMTAELLNDFSEDTEALPLAGGTMTGDLNLGDNVKAQFGASDDLQIYHSGSTSYISDTGTGDLLIQGSSKIRLTDSSANNYFQGTEGGQAQVYYAGSTKLATTDTGVDITGSVVADGLTVDGSVNINADYNSTKYYKADGSTRLGYLVIRDNGDCIFDFDETNSGYPYVIRANNKKVFSAATNGDISFYEDTGTTAKLFWDASAESLGIGTSSPTSPLTIKSSSTSSTAAGLTIQGNSNTNNLFALGEKSTDGARFHMYDGGVEKIAFYTDGTDNHISAGNLGVGTDDPQATLDVSNGTGSDTVPILKLGSNATHGHTFYDSSSNGDLIIKRMVVGVENETMRLSRSSGNVGIGTSSPAHNLDISPASGDAELKISGAEGQSASIRLFADQGDDAADIKRLLTDTSGNFKIQHYMSSAYVDSMVIDSSGNVSIPTGTMSDQDGNIRSGRKNLIINGGFDVWQRGTTFSQSDEYCADRWNDESSGATITITQQSFTLGQTDVPNNPKYYLRWAITTGNDNARIVQKIEGVSTFAGETVTLSYWAKHSSGTLPTGIKTSLRQEFGTGGSPSSTLYTSGSNISLSSSWQKFTQTFTVPSVSGKTLGTNNNDYLGVALGWQVGSETSAYTIDFANVQLELGSTATEFEHRSYGEELALCQRYYEKFGVSRRSGNRASGTIETTPAFYKTTKRADPTLSFSGTSYTYDGWSYAFGGHNNPTGSNDKKHFANLECTASSAIGAGGVMACIIIADAEL